MALQPIATALFAASPFIEGMPSGLSHHVVMFGKIQIQIDAILPFVFEDGMGYERYVDYAWMFQCILFIERKILRRIRTVFSIMRGSLPALPGKHPPRAIGQII